MSPLIEAQAAFLLDACKLIQRITENGYVVTGGELYRTLEQQQIYLKTGRSKTLNSQHLNRLAIDLNIFKDGVLQGRPGLVQIGLYWEGLHPKNRWGGSWRGEVDAGRSSFVDTPHFERQL